ncbi:arginine N-succinyltransferase [Coralliovum pocilloporae]|uniref:arginine N-succinyltransferase n=1 Tax=Coralliovum pocilloporae TaxID=3066369 RepID=UPI0033079D9D
MLIARGVRAADEAALTELILSVSGHMTTMPRSPKEARHRIDHALSSLDKTITEPGDEAYLFVLEENGAIVGLSAIYASVGLDRPFYNYRVARIAKASPDLDIRVDAQVLHLVNDYVGAAELGTLYLSPDARGGGRGRLISFTRLMFLAAFRERFPDRVMAEIRGWTDEEGNSPFWDAVGRQFFKLDLTTADQRSGRDYRFIAELMPSYPIYADLLPDSARDVVAVPHDGAAGALRLLESQGFSYENLVDIFDAGPCIEARQKNIGIVRDARRYMVQKSDSIQTGEQKCLISNLDLEQFVTVQGAVSLSGEMISLSDELRIALNVGEGEPVLVYPMERK